MEKNILHKTHIETRTWMPGDEFMKAPSYQRRYYESHINKILRDLHEGKTFLESFVVSRRVDGTEILLDGNHRAQALARYGKPMDIKLEVYENITEADEKSIYEQYNQGKPHTADEMILPYLKDVNFFNLVQQHFPVPVSYVPQDRYNKILPSILVRMAMIMDSESIPILSKDSILKFVKSSLNETHYFRLVTFFNLLIPEFGTFEAANLLWRPNLLLALCSIFAKLYDESIFTRFLRFIKEKQGLFVNYRNFSYQNIARTLALVRQQYDKMEKYEKKTNQVTKAKPTKKEM